MKGLICKNLMLYQTYIRFPERTLMLLLIFNECSNEWFMNFCLSVSVIYLNIIIKRTDVLTIKGLSSLYFILLFSETESHSVSPAVLELAGSADQADIKLTEILSLLSVGIKGVYHHHPARFFLFMLFNSTLKSFILAKHIAVRMCYVYFKVEHSVLYYLFKSTALVTYSSWILVKRNTWINLLEPFKVGWLYYRVSLYSSTGLKIFLYPSLPSNSKSSCFCYHLNAAVLPCIMTPDRLLLWLSLLAYFLWNNPDLLTVYLLTESVIFS